ncbi:MAG: DoxX family protein [Thermomicrobiales bacterium]
MTSFGLLIIRLITGATFSIHGYTKVFGGKEAAAKISPEVEEVLGVGFTQHVQQGGIGGTTQSMQKLGIPQAKLAAIALAAAELGGGLALIFGWKTRLAALALTVSQLVAIDKVHGKHGLIADQGYELNAALTAATAGLAFSGPGKLAVD